MWILSRICKCFIFSLHPCLIYIPQFSCLLKINVKNKFYDPGTLENNDTYITFNAAIFDPLPPARGSKFQVTRKQIGEKFSDLENLLIDVSIPFSTFIQIWHNIKISMLKIVESKVWAARKKFREWVGTVVRNSVRCQFPPYLITKIYNIGKITIILYFLL